MRRLDASLCAARNARERAQMRQVGRGFLPWLPLPVCPVHGLVGLLAPSWLGYGAGLGLDAGGHLLNTECFGVLSSHAR
jgi:hypothetical protein